MECRNGHSKHPRLFVPTERRKAEKGQGARCMACQKAAREKTLSKLKPARGSAWRKDGHAHIFLGGTGF